MTRFLLLLLCSFFCFPFHPSCYATGDPEFNNYPVSALTFSPDGDYLAIAGEHYYTAGDDGRRCNNSHIWLWNVATKKIDKTIPMKECIAFLVYSPDGRYITAVNDWSGILQFSEDVRVSP